MVQRFQAKPAQTMEYHRRRHEIDEEMYRKPTRFVTLEPPHTSSEKI